MIGLDFNVLILCAKTENLYILIDGKKHKIGWWYFMDHPTDNIDTTNDLDYLRFRVQSYLIDGDDDDYEDTFLYSDDVESEIVDFVNGVLSR